MRKGDKSVEFSMKKIALHNLGCKVNSYEIEVMQQLLQEKGYEIVPFNAGADVYIINTCTVTNMADRKSRQMLHRAKAMNPDAVVVAVGCYVQTGGEKALLDDSIDLAIGNNKKKDLIPILEEYLRQREISADGKIKTLQDTTVIDVNNTCDYEEMTLKRTADHTRACIKIQDGCNQFCSYCIIPFARGRVRSRKAEDIVQEIRGLVAAGYQEVVLTGIHISSYGIDFEDEAWQHGISRQARREEGRNDYRGKSKLMDLIEQIHDIEGLRRIRLGSLEPRIVTAEAAARLGRLPKICPHFHLSLQSGCDETLKRMNRHYTAGEYYDSVKNLRRAFERPAITTDVIVGFPGETEEEFEETCAFLEKVGFYEMHIFKYSKRQGTRAAKMSGQVPEQQKTQRSNRLLVLEKQQSKEFRSCYIGKEAEVLFEEEKELGGKNFWIGHTEDYVKVALESRENLSNILKKVRVTDFLTDEILKCDSLD